MEKAILQGVNKNIPNKIFQHILSKAFTIRMSLSPASLTKMASYWEKIRKYLT